MNKQEPLYSEYDKRRWFSKGIRMTGNLYKDGLHMAKLAEIKGTVVTIERVFKNEEPMALNHWIGIIRFAYPWGYRQYMRGVAAGENDAYDIVRNSTIKDLRDYDFDFWNNEVKFARPSDYLPEEED